MFNEIYFFEEHNRDFLNEKWSVAIQFPDDKILIDQISARCELARFVTTFIVLDDDINDYLVPKQIDDLNKIIKLLEIIHKCNNPTIHHNYKIYLDYIFSSIVYSKEDKYESRYSMEIENNIIRDINIKKKNEYFEKLFLLV